MDCFQDFCLACDRQSTSGPYCSPACRLADLEKAGSSGQTSPTTTGPQTRQQSDSEGSRRLAVASSDRALTMASSPRRRMQEAATAAASDRSTTMRSLSPSSSRSSLSSIDSATAASHNMSESARAELQDYFSSFHKTRAAKRRQSTW